MCPLSEIVLSTGFYLIQIPSRNKLNAKLDLASGSINPVLVRGPYPAAND
jgi:hypothetical protein